MHTLTIGRLRISAVVERAGPMRPTWLLPDATPEAGDVMHHPIQTAEPQWASGFDSDAEAAKKTRREFCERHADTGVAVLGTHFHHPTAGRIVRHGETWRFVVDAGR